VLKGLFSKSETAFLTLSCWRRCFSDHGALIIGPRSELEIGPSQRNSAFPLQEEANLK